MVPTFEFMLLNAFIWDSFFVTVFYKRGKWKSEMPFFAIWLLLQVWKSFLMKPLSPSHLFFVDAKYETML